MQDIDVDEVMRAVLGRLMTREGFSDPSPASSAKDDRYLRLGQIDRYLRHQYGMFGETIICRRHGLAGKVELFIKKVVRKLLSWYAKPQIEFNRSTAHAVRECLEHLTALQEELATLRDEVRLLSSRFDSRNPSSAGYRYPPYEGRESAADPTGSTRRGN